MSDRYLIIDDNGVIWSSDSVGAFDEGCSIMSAVERGKAKGYKKAIGEDWSGDLVFVKEISRTR